MTSLTELVDLEDVRSSVDRILSDRLDALRDLLAATSRDAAPLVAGLAQLVAGGKRMRAALCYWSFRAHGGQPGTPLASAALGVGAALEIFQAAALFHDDIMDESDTRRGMPSAHRSFEASHHAWGLSGDAEQFGIAAAILLGDIALVASEQQYAESTADLRDAQRSRALFDDMRTEAMTGQYLDMLAQAMPWGADPREDERRAREVILAKSARYSVEHPMVIGGLLAGADPDGIARIRAVGLPLGEAFQLRDDLLGVFGDPATTGKPAGDDLREGKRTVLVARAAAAALASGDTSTSRLLARRLGDRSLSDDDVAELTQAIASTGAPDEVEALIAELAAQAFEAIGTSGWPEPARGVIGALAHAAVARRS